MDDDKEYFLFDDDSMSQFHYGKSMDYNSSRIYAAYYHSEIYVHSHTEPYFRVGNEFIYYRIGKLSLLLQTLIRALHGDSLTTL